MGNISAKYLKDVHVQEKNSSKDVMVLTFI